MAYAFRLPAVPVSEFVDAITPMANIVMSDIAAKKFNYGVSNGLRTLQDAGKIKMEHIHDQEDMQLLFQKFLERLRKAGLSLSLKKNKTTIGLNNVEMHIPS